MERGLQKLKIAWLLEEFPSPYQEYIKNLFLNLKRMYGLDITIVTYKLLENDIAKNHAVKEIKVYRFFDEIMKRIKISPFNNVERLLKDFDLVHIQQSFLYPVISTLAKSDHSPKFIITFRGADSYIKPWVNSKWIKYHHEIRDHFDGIQVMSNNQKKYILKWGHDFNSVYTIPISTSTYKDSFVHGRIQSPLRICSVFRMTWEKNVELNLRLVKELIRRGIMVQYNVYGDGADFGQLYYLVDRFNLNEYVKIHGRVSPEMLANEIKNNHLLFQLSSSEALPASVIEALSFGIPCVVSDVGGFPEIIRNDINGYLMNFNNYEVIPAANFVEQLIKDDELYQRLKKGAFSTFEEEFSPSVEAAKIFNMYSSIFKVKRY